MNIRNSLELILGSSHPRFSDCFYENIFRQYPEVKAYFQGVDLRRQGILLVMAVQIVIDHHLRPHLAMENYLRILGNRHHQLGIQIPDYQKFEGALLATLEGFHKELWDEALAVEWRRAYEKAVCCMAEGHADNFQVP